MLAQALRFGVVGVLNTGAGLAAIYGLMWFFHTPPAAANAAGYALGQMISFGLNRAWTFRTAQRRAADALPRYILAVAFCYSINLASLLTAVRVAVLNPYAAQLIGMCAYSVTMFAACKWFVFATPRLAVARETPVSGL